MWKSNGKMLQYLTLIIHTWWIQDNIINIQPLKSLLMMLELVQILALRECLVHHSRQIYLFYKCINVIIIINYTYKFHNLNMKTKHLTYTFLHYMELSFLVVSIEQHEYLAFLQLLNCPLELYVGQEILQLLQFGLASIHWY